MNVPDHFTNPWLRWQEAAVEESLNLAGRMRVLPGLLQRAQAVRKGVSASEVVYEEDRLKLLHYVSDAPPRHHTPLLFVYALVNRPYILDLKKGRSVVAKFVEQGFDTYLVDWGVPAAADRFLTLDDYINGYLANVLDFLCERTGVEQVNLLGYCMGGTMSAIFSALHPKAVKNLILLAAPIDFATRDGLLNVWTDSQSFNVDKFVDAFGDCPAEFLQAAFLCMRPIQNFIQKPIHFFEHMHDEKFLDDFFATETWLQDNIPVPGETYREFVKYLYQQNLLVKGRLPIGKHTVKLDHITCPVLNLIAGEDDLVPCAQSVPFADCVGSRDRQTILLKGTGHIGLAIGGRAQQELWPQACAWLAKRDN
jgi:polyhydroxyalkanoate synthase